MKKIALVLSFLFFASVAFGQSGAKLAAMGFMRVNDLDSTIAVNIVYATPDNFTGKILYADLRDAYLHPDAARALVRAQKALREAHPRLSIIIYDAARPVSVQKYMWDTVKNTPNKNYVSNPANGGGLHNYGVAVDVSLIDMQSNAPLSMGAGFDHFGPESHITDEQGLVVRGLITAEELSNRLLLRQIMIDAGFIPIATEWWHFNFCTRSEAIAKYKIINW